LHTVYTHLLKLEVHLIFHLASKQAKYKSRGAPDLPELPSLKLFHLASKSRGTQFLSHNLLAFFNSSLLGFSNAQVRLQESFTS
jgi:hypothetical protein